MLIENLKTDTFNIDIRVTVEAKQNLSTVRGESHFHSIRKNLHVNRYLQSFKIAPKESESDKPERYVLDNT